ncbi:MAG TPA: hypothetical protein PK022_07375 [Syntrophales bacterium]|nr:hypothetical protein [Syntrophales bacterium]
MAHQDKGHYAAKHPAETPVDEQIAKLIAQQAKDDIITCSDAVAIAAAIGKTIQEVGVALDLLETRISFCQMGLFGFSPDKQIVRPAGTVDETLKKAIEVKLQNGRLSCAESWAIADEFNLPRMAVSEACEALKIKIKPCQLGAF